MILIEESLKAEATYLSVPASPYRSTSLHSSTPSSPYGSPRPASIHTQYSSNTHDEELPPPYQGTPSAPPASVSVSASDAGPSQPSSPSLLSRMKSFTGTSPVEILSTLPPSFSRVPPADVPYAPFAPCALVSLSHALDKGFPALAPPSTQPHPFAAHDVLEADWLRFLSDVKRAGALSPLNHVMAEFAPWAVGIGPLGFFITKGMKKLMKKQRVGPVSEIIDHWNYYFFYPRRMEIALLHGDRPQSTLSRTSSRTSLSDSSDSEAHASRRRERGVLGLAQRARMAGRGRERLVPREQTTPARKKWQLVVSYKPSTPQSENSL
ncbi:hypothetical protein EIP86_007321 [Pleurotus ostreatoroseus]|nr:hypothetical protein EIP86_007321 [Pleurotus ostreatoroseus]